MTLKTIEDRLTTAGFTPELQILLMAASNDLNRTRRQRLDTLLQQTIDWSRLLELGQVHGLLPLLHRYLVNYADEAVLSTVPAAVKDALRGHYFATAAQALLLQSEQERICDALQAAGVPVMPFKGVQLARRLYRDEGLRPTGDIDLLIQQHQIEQAVATLQRDGYELLFQVESSTRREVFRQTTHHFVLKRPGRQTMVELHWDVASPLHPLAVDWPSIWVRAETGEHGQVLSAEDLLILLCIHGGRHRWESAKWIVDVARLLDPSVAVDFDIVQHRARTWHAERMMLLGLAVVDRLGVATLPDDARAAIAADSTVLAMVDEVRMLLEDPVGLNASDETRIGFNARLHSTLSSRIRYSWGLVTGLNVQDIDQLGRSRLHYRLSRMRRMWGKYGFRQAVEIVLRLGRSS